MKLAGAARKIAARRPRSWAAHLLPLAGRSAQDAVHKYGPQASSRGARRRRRKRPGRRRARRWKRPVRRRARRTKRPVRRRRSRMKRPVRRRSRRTKRPVRTTPPPQEERRHDAPEWGGRVPGPTMTTNGRRPETTTRGHGDDVGVARAGAGPGMKNPERRRRRRTGPGERRLRRRTGPGARLRRRRTGPGERRARRRTGPGERRARRRPGKRERRRRAPRLLACAGFPEPGQSRPSHVRMHHRMNPYIAQA